MGQRAALACKRHLVIAFGRSIFLLITNSAAADEEK